MKTLLKLSSAAAAVTLLAACGTTVEQRAATGALAGAAAGQVIGGDTTATVAGAVVGGVAGAATTPRRRPRGSGDHENGPGERSPGPSSSPRRRCAYQMRARASGARYCSSPGLTPNASYQASMFRTVALARY